jgi:hypothetical protein
MESSSKEGKKAGTERSQSPRSSEARDTFIQSPPDMFNKRRQKSCATLLQGITEIGTQRAMKNPIKALCELTTHRDSGILKVHKTMMRIARWRLCLCL